MSIEFVAQEFWDYVNESAVPVAIKILEGNFLFVEIADSTAIEASVEFSEAITAAEYTYEEAYNLYTATRDLTAAEKGRFLRALLRNTVDFESYSWPSDAAFEDYFYIDIASITSDTTAGTTRTIVIYSEGSIDGYSYQETFTYVITPTQLITTDAFIYPNEEVPNTTEIFTYTYGSYVINDDCDPGVAYCITMVHVDTVRYQYYENGVEMDDTTDTYVVTTSVSTPWVYFITNGFATEPTIDDLANGQRLPTAYVFYPTIYNPLYTTTNRPQFTDPAAIYNLPAAWTTNLTLTLLGNTLGVRFARLAGTEVKMGDVSITGTDTAHTQNTEVNAFLLDGDPFLGYNLDTAYVSAADLLHWETYPDVFFYAQDTIWWQDIRYARALMTGYKNYTQVYDSGSINYTGLINTAVAAALSADGQVAFNAGDTIGTRNEATLAEVIVPAFWGPEKYGVSQDVFYMISSVSVGKKYRLVRYSAVESVDYGNATLAGLPGPYTIGPYPNGGAPQTAGLEYQAIVDAMEAAYATLNPYGILDPWNVGDTNTRTITSNGISYTAQTFPSPGYNYATLTIPKALIGSYRYRIYESNVYLDECEARLCSGWGPTEWYEYDSSSGSFTLSGDTPPTLEQLNLLSLCEAAPLPGGYGSIIGRNYPGNAPNPAQSVTFDGTEYTLDATDPDFPAATFNLQTGTPAPVYPTYQGAFVYDIELKKWGKMKMSFLSLLDFAPVNTQSSQLLPSARYGVAGGILDSNGAIYQWDANPTDAYIKYGKFSLFRLGVTTIQEIEAQFGIQSTGTLETETSLDGKTIDLSLSTSYTFTGERVVKAPISKTGVWHNIILRGQFDLTYLQVNAYRSGRR